MNARTTEEASRLKICTYQPCRNYDQEILVGIRFSCPHAPNCPIEDDPNNARSKHSVYVAMGGAVGVGALALLLISSLQERRVDSVRSRPTAVSVATQPNLVDYEREVEELVSFSRQILEKTEAIRVFREQLTESYVDFSEPTRSRWAGAVEVKQAEQSHLCNRVVIKIGHLMELDRQTVDSVFARLVVGKDLDVEGRRLSKSFSFAKKHWDLVKSGQDLRPNDLVTSANSLMPF